MKKILLVVIGAVFILASSSSVGSVYAAGSCAKVAMEIAQELTLERVAFDAKLVIVNNLPDRDLADVRVDVSIRDGNDNVKTELFFLKLSSSNNIEDVNGNGVVKAGTTAEVHWTIIPSPGAGGTTPIGTEYKVGATLTYAVGSTEEIVSITPDTITVKPTAEIVLDYFTPYEVLGDNPFTSKVEAPVPYALAIRVINDGYGKASNLSIDSAQPEIVSNEEQLLVNFQILGTKVDDRVVDPTLTVNFGDLESKSSATAYWEMLSTMSGKIENFDVSFTHASELGGELTSIIRETNAHYLTHMVKVNLSGRDDRLDFLADTDGDVNHLPDTIFESEIPIGFSSVDGASSSIISVYPAIYPNRPTPELPAVEMSLDLTDKPTGWVYTRLSDPAKGMLELLDVVRADGVRLDPNNFWVDEGLDDDYKQTYTLQFIDYRSDEFVTGLYTLLYNQPEVDMMPPSTALIFDGSNFGTDPTYITPETRILLTAKDNEGGSGIEEMFRRIVEVDSDFVPALPFNLTAAGAYTLEYYSVDSAGNEEPVRRANIVVDNSAPEITVFTATPEVYTPHAPYGVIADRTIEFIVKAFDTVEILVFTIEVLDSGGNVLKTIKDTGESDHYLSMNWDGKDEFGVIVPTAIYTIRLSVTDGLEDLVVDSALSHTVTTEITVTAVEWFAETPVDSDISAEQMYPDMSATKVVWQDKRNGSWDIYLKDLSNGELLRLTDNSSDEQRPAIDGNIIVWQDERSGSLDIYGYDLDAGQEFIVTVGAGDQSNPDVSAAWVVWQDKRFGNWDIFAKNIESSEVIQITAHERDQIRPAISGDVLAWEDYRYGLGEIYKYNLSARVEERVTLNAANQTLPAISGSTLVWTDERAEVKDIYSLDTDKTESRVTYGVGDHTQSAVLNTTLIYTDYDSGSDDPNLSFQDLKSGVGGRLSSNPAIQEEPSLGSGYVVWQDTRDGIYQVYKAEMDIEVLPIEVKVRPGFNLIAVGQRLVDEFVSVSSFIESTSEGISIERALSFNSLHGTYTEAQADGNDFGLVKGMGLVVYAAKAGSIEVANSDEESFYKLLPGANQIGVLTVPNGYTAYDLMKSVGLEKIQSVRRFDNLAGAWETVAVRVSGKGSEMVGANFVIRPGDGLVIMMRNRVDGWKP